MIRSLHGFLLVLVLTMAGGGAADAGAPLSRGDYLTIKVAVIGPGDELYFWWGHLGLLIEDRLTDEARFYDYGVFTFDGGDFISNFAFGRLWYTTSVSNAASVINRFIETDRSVTLYTLDLDAAQKLELFRLAEHDVQPENRNYLYNHFTDNCVTRILRNLDTVIGGTLSQQALETPGRLTLRGHVRRHTAAHPVWDWLLNFWMGQVIDKPVSVWQEMFLPSEVGRFIEGFSYTAADGAQHKLVSQVENIYTARRAPVLEAPWNSLGGALAVGVLIALFFYQLEIFKKKNAGLARRLLGAGHALLGIVFGIAGSLLFFLTFFTNHDYTFENSNVLFVNPLLLLAVPFGALLAVTNNEKKARIYENVLCMLWTYVFLAALLSRIITIVPSYYQNNGFVIAVLLPISYMLGVPRIMLRKLISAGLRRQK